MVTKKIIPVDDTSTEEKIKNAAREVFHRKGFAATRTRDIAEAAGINLALLNYYFRSKEKLFDLIMLETLQGFLKSITMIFNEETTSLEQKLEIMVSSYIDMLTANPDIPLFLLSELRANPEGLASKIGVKEVVMQSYFMKQFKQGVKSGKIGPILPIHFIMNLMGLIVFPFVASPLLKGIGDLSGKEYVQLMQQRKLLIPQWIKLMLKAK